MSVKRMLVIDDEIKIAEMYRQIFYSIGYDVLTAVNPIDAYELLRGKKFDIVLLDINMPEMDGAILFDKMGKWGNDTKVVVASVYSIDEQKERIKGADGYFDKSDGKNGLIRLVSSLMGRTSMDNFVSKSVGDE